MFVFNLAVVLLGIVFLKVNIQSWQKNSKRMVNWLLNGYWILTAVEDSGRYAYTIDTFQICLNAHETIARNRGGEWSSFCASISSLLFRAQ